MPINERPRLYRAELLHQRATGDPGQMVLAHDIVTEFQAAYTCELLDRTDTGRVLTHIVPAEDVQDGPYLRLATHALCIGARDTPIHTRPTYMEPSCPVPTCISCLLAARRVNERGGRKPAELERRRTADEAWREVCG